MKKIVNLLTLTIAACLPAIGFSQQTFLERMEQALKKELGQPGVKSPPEADSLFNSIDELPKPFIADRKAFSYYINMRQGNDKVAGTVTLTGAIRGGISGISVDADLNGKSQILWLPYKEKYLKIVKGSYSKQQAEMHMLSMQGVFEMSGESDLEKDDTLRSKAIKAIIYLNDPGSVKGISHAIKAQQTIQSLDKAFADKMKQEQGVLSTITDVQFQGKKALQLDVKTDKNGGMESQMIFSQKHDLPIVASIAKGNDASATIKLLNPGNRAH